MGIRWRKSSKFWYAEFQVNGRRQTARLNPIKGVRPASLKESGDWVFEQSRAKAIALAEEKKREAQAAGVGLAYYRRMVQLLEDREKPAPKVRRIALGDLYESWRKATDHKKRSDMYLVRIEAVCRRFADFAAEQGVRRLDRVSPELALAYVNYLKTIPAPVRKPRSKKAREAAAKRKPVAVGLAPGTINDHVSALRSIFAKLGPDAGMDRNPWAKVPLLAKDPIHRRPLTEEETEALVAACDSVVRGPVVTGICTALRRADACRLRWEDVDLKAGFVMVRTGKTGATAEIPIFPMLRKELERAGGKRGTSNVERSKYCWPEAARLVEVCPQTLSKRVADAFDRAGIERLVERAGPGIQRRAGVADFHALRTTWITKALAAGVPMELVRRVTGHSTVDVVLRHYFRPGRAEFRKALSGMWRKKKATEKTRKGTNKKACAKQMKKCV